MKVLYILYQLFIALPILLVLTILTAIVTIIGSWIGDPHFWGYYPGKIWSQLFCYVLLIPVKVVGHPEVLKKTSYVFVANHQGSFDIFLIYGFLGRNFKWMMKKSLRKMPFVGKACEAAGHIFVDKSGPKKVIETIEHARHVLQNGTSLVVFPEGARTFTGHMGYFKKGAFQLAEVLKSVKPAYYIAGLVMIVVFVCCESYIIYRMLRLLHYNDVPKRNCVKYSFVGFFFSCITPSATGGQPMQLYYMNRDKVDISVGTVILMIVTILYKFVLVFLGALIFLFRHFLVAEYIGKAAFFFYLGMALNVFCVAFMLILVFEPTLASKIVLWLFQKLEKFHILKKKEERLEKLQNSMIEYHKAAAIIQGHRIFIFRMFVVTLIQRLIHFSITYLVYRAMGLSALGFIDVVALQSVISISVDMLPLPGGMGISEGLFLNIFKKIFVGGLLYPAMLLSRGISYYALVLISAVMTGVAHVTIKRKE